ncbi:hypothetical protein J7J24_00830 [bacterium]|nr:hypothetical protein [bacterium]
MKQKLQIFYALSLGFGMGIIISAFVVAIILMGVNFYKKYTTPWSIILSILAALVVAILLIYYFAAPFLKHKKK